MNVNVRDLQLVQFNILQEFKRVCNKNDIDFYLAYGSCLGAVRHSGFIPWDDDIDVFIKYDDYIKLCSLKNEFSSGFFLQTNATDPEYGLSIARLRDSNSTLIEEESKSRDINHGVFIDIYPLYNCPGSGFSYFYLKLNAVLYRLFMYDEGTRNKGLIFNFISSYAVKMTPFFLKKYFIEKFHKKVGGIKGTGFLSTFYGSDFSVKYDDELFGEPVMVVFEGDEYPTPTNSDKFLSSMYGDYMKLPSKENRKIHHNFLFIDLNKSYKIYKGDKYLKDEA